LVIKRLINAKSVNNCKILTRIFYKLGNILVALWLCEQTISRKDAEPQILLLLNLYMG